MTILPAYVILADGAALIELEDGRVTMLTTAAAAERLGDLCRRAQNAMLEHQRRVGAEADHRAAVAVNEQHRASHDAWGAVIGSPLNPPVPPPSPQKPCGCTAAEHCTDCVIRHVASR